MSVEKPSIASDEAVAGSAADAAGHRGPSLSPRLDRATERALVLESGLAEVRGWESEHGELAAGELAWADGVLGAYDDRQGSSPVPGIT